MKCPTCHCEVMNQPICPYCGATVYIPAQTYRSNDYSSRTTSVADRYGTDGARRNKNVERRLKNLEMKLDMLMILTGGNLLLILILLLAVLLK